MWSDESDADEEMLPAVLKRPVLANHIVQERITMDTSDFQDHTFSGMMFDVKCIDSLPIEFLEITSIAVRGGLGPMTVWTTPSTFQGKYHNEASKQYWSLIYEGTHTQSLREFVPLELRTPVRLGAGQSCGLFVHSQQVGDNAVVYDNVRRAAQSNSLLTIMPGLAALDNRPFGQIGMWGEGWRSRREFVGRIGMGVCWKLWNPECHQLFPAEFRSAARCLLLCASRPSSPLHVCSDAVIFYILNMCRWDWFGGASPADTLMTQSEPIGIARGGYGLPISPDSRDRVEQELASHHFGGLLYGQDPMRVGWESDSEEDYLSD